MTAGNRGFVEGHFFFERERTNRWQIQSKTQLRQSRPRLGKGDLNHPGVRRPGPRRGEPDFFKGKDLHQVKSHTINYGHIIDPASGETVDEVMVSVMLAPKTYTKEDVVEINCHGGCWRLTGPYN